MITFKVLKTSNLSNGYFEITGSFINIGEISQGDFISIPNGKYSIDIQMSSFEIDNSKQIKVILNSDDKKKLNGIDLCGEKITILKPIRGADIQLTLGYGIGVKWWAGLVTLIIIAISIWILIMTNK